MRGVFAFKHGWNTWRHIIRGARFAAINRSCKLFRIRFAREPVYGYVKVIRVTQILGAIGVSEARDLREQMNVFRAACAHLPNGEMLQNIQHLENVNTTRTGRWHRNDFIAVISPAQCRTRFRLVGGERLHVNEAAATAHFGGDFFCDGSFVESIRTFVCDGLKRVCKVGLDENIASLIGNAVRLIEIPTSRFVSAQTRLTRS